MKYNEYQNIVLNNGGHNLGYRAYDLESGLVIYLNGWDMVSEGPDIFIPRHKLTESSDGKTFDLLFHFAKNKWMTVGLLYEIARIIYRQAQIEQINFGMYQTLKLLDTTVKDDHELFERMDLYEMDDM